MKNGLFFIIIAIIVSVSAQGKAEPSKEVYWLMNEPVSMLEWGLYRLNSEIEFDERIMSIISGTKPYARWIYDYENNEIQLQIVYYVDNFEKKIMREKMKESIEYIKVQFPVAKNIGSTILHSYFTHDYYEDANRPKSIGKHIDKITKIVIIAKYSKTKSYKCYSPLVEDKIYCEE